MKLEQVFGVIAIGILSWGALQLYQMNAKVLLMSYKVDENHKMIKPMWEDSDEVWEEMAAMLASFNSINELKQRIALLETELRYMNREHNRMIMNDDGM